MELNQVLLRATAHITAAYVSSHSITRDELAEVIEVVGKALSEGTEPANDQRPGSRRSVKPRGVAVAPQNMRRGFPAQVDATTNGSQLGAGSQDETTRFPQASERPAAPAGIRRRNEQPIVVTDDWPGMIPVTDQEVRIVEAFLGDKLDEIFGAAPAMSVGVPAIPEKVASPSSSNSIVEKPLKAAASSKPKASRSKSPRRSAEDKLTLVSGGPPLTEQEAVKAEERVNAVVMQLARLLGRQMAREVAKEQISQPDEF